jgi:hypothetical protein
MSTFLYTNLIALTLGLREELKDFIQKVIELNFISFVMQQRHNEQMFFKQKERAIDFFFNQLID